MRIFQEEIFGPVVSVTTFKTDEEALAIANDTLYGLGAAIWTRNGARAYRFGRAIQAAYEAGLLLIPLVLNFVGMLEPLLTSGMQDWAGRAYHSPLTVQAGLVPIHFASIADFAGRTRRYGGA